MEHQLFQKLWPNYWTEDERGEFAAYISENPDAGDLIQKSGGVRKVRWSRAGSGKSGGVRVVYFNRGRFDEVVLILIYAKANLDSISGETLKELRDAAEKANG
ncbi:MULTISPECIES: type II toxin-antitoxin system RelE/ParE family toxin [unclassified Variovorax]|uniref:type II toxin-antitoxin system RelE/ParE family toxin n=1 Tax=unclassified Variovorax TaxID=663243 RepID=UPI003F48128E